MSLAAAEHRTSCARSRATTASISRTPKLELFRNLMAGSLGSLAAIDAAPSGLPDVPAGREWWEPSAAREPARCLVRALRDPNARPRSARGDALRGEGQRDGRGPAAPERLADPRGLRRRAGRGDRDASARGASRISGKAHCEYLCLSAGATRTRAAWSTIRTAAATPPAARPPARPRSSPRAPSRSRSAATRAARSACPPPSAARWA